MKEIAEHFGIGFLQLVSGTLWITLFFSLLRGGGALNHVICAYLGSICG